MIKNESLFPTGCGEEPRGVQPIFPPSWPATSYYVSTVYYYGKKFEIFYLITVKKPFW